MAFLSSANALAAEQSAAEHYDTPWEFKNRALAAALGHQQQKQKISEQSLDTENGGNALERQKRLSLPSGQQQRHKDQQQQKGTTRQQQQQREAAKKAEQQQLVMSNSISSSHQAPGRPGSNNFFWLNNSGCQQQGNKCHQAEAADVQRAKGRGFASAVLPMAEKRPPPLPAHGVQHGRAQSLPQASSPAKCSPPSSSGGPSASCSTSSSAKSASRSQPSPAGSAGDSSAAAPKWPAGNGQQQRHHRHRQQLLAPLDQQRKQQQLRSYPLVAIGPSSPTTAKEVLAFCQQQHNEAATAEEADLCELVHERMERTEAELLLGAMPLGTQLLRRRPTDNSLALSLRANEGVLHIKLQHRNGHWVLGEGPRFPSVRTMLRAYRRTELPVRGAEQIRLGPLLRPSDVPGRGLLLL